MQFATCGLLLARGVPDFSCYNIPKLENACNKAIQKYTKSPTPTKNVNGSILLFPACAATVPPLPETWAQGCQMVHFQTKNPNLGKFVRAWDWKMLMYFMAIWNTSRAFEIFYDHLAHCMFIWYIFPVLVSRTNKNLATLRWAATWRNAATLKRKSDTVAQLFHFQKMRR
jgi:hypothetical protein